MNQKTFQAILTLGWFIWLAKQLAGFAKYAISSNVSPAGMITLFGGVVLVGGALVISILQLRTPKKGLAIAMAIPCLLLLLKYYLAGVLIYSSHTGGAYSFKGAIMKVCELQGGNAQAALHLLLIVVSGLAYPGQQFLRRRQVAASGSDLSKPPVLPTEYLAAIAARRRRTWGLARYFAVAFSCLVGAAVVAWLLLVSGKPEEGMVKATIEVQVLEEISGRPLAGATVTLSHHKTTTPGISTDPFGMARINEEFPSTTSGPRLARRTNLATWLHSVSASKTGYASASVSLPMEGVPWNNQPVKVVIKLRAAPIPERRAWSLR